MAESAGIHIEWGDARSVRHDGGARTRRRQGFARGEIYHRQEKVRIASIDAMRVVARVDGTETYSVELTGHGLALSGGCSCPAFETWPFCKHMVATALAANALPAGSDAVGADARIRRHLASRGVEALVDMVMDMAARDPRLFDRLDLAAAASGTDDQALEKRLRKAIEDEIVIDDFVGYEDAASWADGAGQVLDAIADLNAGNRPRLAFDLAERALDAIADALDSIDDLEGECSGLLDRAWTIHLEAARLTRPDPIALAKDLYHREIEDEHDTFTGALTLYADILGERGEATYRALAAEAWSQLRPRTAADRSDYDDAVLYDRLAGILDVFAAREGDTDARVALRAKDLSSPWRYFELVDFCRTHGRDAEALRWAEEGLWIFEDQRRDERLLSAAVDLYVRAGRSEDAARLLQAAFRRAPTFDLYQDLKTHCGPGAREAALQIVEAQIEKAPRNAWSHPADLLVEILSHEKMLDAAWAAVGKHGSSKSTQRALALASEATHAREALLVHTAHVEELVQSGGNASYQEAARLVARMAGLQDKREHAAYLDALKTWHGRKRNLMKLLG